MVSQAKHAKLFLISVWLSGLIVWLGFSPTPTHAQTTPGLPEKMVLENFPVFGQWHNLSCEYSSTRMITAFWQREIGEADFIANVPFNPDPHIGFRGNIDEWFGGTWHYGIYGEPIARFIETRGFKTKFLAGRDDTLRQELALGRPVQVWVIAGMGWGSPFTEYSDGKPFRLAAGEHSIVVYGYDQWGVYIADPAYGGRAYYNWDTFLRSWSYFDYMAMSVWPADKPVQKEPNIGISHWFYRHWLNNGGMAVYGHPITEPFQEGELLVQYFERARLEVNTSNLSNPVLVALLGAELNGHRLSEQPFKKAAAFNDSATSAYFEITGHNLSQGFREYWQNNGGLANFGYPLSEEFFEDGKIVQYFERARFEYYPNNPDPYKILLGRLGVERMSKYGTSLK